VCHVAQDGEDDGGGKEACEGVDGADDQGVPVAVVVELVVASQGKESTNADSIRVEDLSASVDPNLRLPESLPLRSEQELQSVASTLKCKSFDTEDGKNDIGKDGANPEDLGSRNTLDTEP